MLLTFFLNNAAEFEEGKRKQKRRERGKIIDM
jgi:hypothetical protein